MGHDRNWIVDVCLFSGLACFSFFSVVLFSDIEPRHQHMLIALLPLLTVILAFNVIGFLALWIRNRVRSFMCDPLRRKKELALVGGAAAVGLFLINYLVLSIYTYICTILKDEFRLTYSSFGPTEFRLVVIILNTVYMYTPGTDTRYLVLGCDFGVFDFIGLAIAAFLFLIHFCQFVKDRKVLSLRDPLKPFNSKADDKA